MLPARETDVVAMTRARELAAIAAAHGDIPVGAVVTDLAGRIVGEGANRREVDADPFAHAEVLALRAAARARGSWNLEHCTLVVTLEPCLMCAGAILQARVDRVVFGAWDDKAGAAGSVYDVLRDRRLPHRAEVVGGVAEADAVAQLRAFFDVRRRP
ncbi:nucleoside deaminase [Microbacterium sp.]|uniref:nucleoside deaminase n=1 Tax=Microbacterium sp. TaxID=51671 RepID=UPI003A8BF853